MTTHTRDSLALAHHRFYCQGHDLEFCEANDTDRDFAEFAMQQLAETGTGCEETSEVVSSQPTNDDGAATPPADTGAANTPAAVSATGVRAPEAAPSSHIFVHSEAFVVPLEDPADREGGEQDDTQLGLVIAVGNQDGQQVLGTCSPEPPSGGAS